MKIHSIKTGIVYCDFKRKLEHLEKPYDVVTISLEACKCKFKKCKDCPERDKIIETIRSYDDHNTSD